MCKGDDEDISGNLKAENKQHMTEKHNDKASYQLSSEDDVSMQLSKLFVHSFTRLSSVYFYEINVPHSFWIMSSGVDCSQYCQKDEIEIY